MGEIAAYGVVVIVGGCLGFLIVSGCMWLWQRLDR